MEVSIILTSYRNMQGKNQAFLEMEEESSAVAMVNYFTNCAAQLRDRSGRTPHVSLPVLDPDSGFSVDRIRAQVSDDWNRKKLTEGVIQISSLCSFSGYPESRKSSLSMNKKFHGGGGRGGDYFFGCPVSVFGSSDLISFGSEFTISLFWT